MCGGVALWGIPSTLTTLLSAGGDLVVGRVLLECMVPNAGQRHHGGVWRHAAPHPPRPGGETQRLQRPRSSLVLLVSEVSCGHQPGL